MRKALIIGFLMLALMNCETALPPTPQPTATPMPTATPFLHPSPLPTATPMTLPRPIPTATPMRFPTALPTPTPMIFPTALPTATPMVVVFPTPLPTSTPMPTATPQTFTSRSVPPTNTPRPTARPRPTATNTPTPTPTPRPVTARPTATPAPHGHVLSGKWTVVRSGSGMAIQKWSADGNTGASLFIACTGGDVFVAVLYNARFRTISSGSHSTRVSVDGDVKIERWSLSPSGEMLISPNTKRTLDAFDGGKKVYIETTIGGENRWSVFELAGLKAALKQIQPC